jgi:hypothetical protein
VELDVGAGGFFPPINWDSDIVQTGCVDGTKITRGTDGEQGPMTLFVDPFTSIFNAEGTLTSTVDGVEWTQPANGN